MSATVRRMSLRLLLIATAGTVAGSAGAQPAVVDACRLYGFAPHTADYRECRLNLRHYWSTGPCRDGRFAWTHRGYCHLYPPHDF
jgi:hypothetical protein